MAAHSEEWSAAYKKLDEVAQELHRLIERDHGDPDDPAALPTDYVLAVGWQFFDADNDRAGGVSLFPKEGSQPSYITAGLLQSALHSQLNR